MIPAEFDYVLPSTLDEALQALAARSDDAKFLAGGHSLIPLMKLRLASPALLIDLGRIEGLRGIAHEGGRLSIGAMTTHAQIAESPLVREHAPALAQAAGEIGDRQVRARGTIGGSIAHSDPAADLPAVMLALDGELHVISTRGERSIAAADFFQDLFLTDLAPNELIVRVTVQASPRSAYVKFPNPASHYAITGVAVALQGDGTIASARIGVTGAAPSAYRATAAEAALNNNALSEATIGAAADAAYDGRELLGDIFASAEYRASLIRTGTRRALQKLLP